MSLPRGVTLESLSDQLADAVAGRKVVAAVFTSFTLDPGFFELEILPILFPDRSFSHVAKAKRVQLEQALLGGPKVTVMYDHRGLAQEGTPAHLDWRRVAIRRRVGIFHPKVTLVLVEDPIDEDDDEPDLALIMGIASANLTQSGWWANLEVAHFEEIVADRGQRRRIPFRRDLLDMLTALARSITDGEKHDALDEIRNFVRYRTNTSKYEYEVVKGKFLTRVFWGQKSFANWLEEFCLYRHDFNLDVISPFFDGSHAKTLEKVIEATQPKATRVYLPLDIEGEAQVDERAYDAMNALPRVDWGTLPTEMVKRAGNAKQARLSNRGVHAKVYRFWNTEGREVVIAGSVNLTQPAHTAENSGNFEVGTLVDTSSSHRRGWWLKRSEDRPESFKTAEETSEDEGYKKALVDVDVSFDWRESRLAVRSPLVGAELELRDTTGDLLATHRVREELCWEECEVMALETLQARLGRSSFVEVHHDNKRWRVLVREEGMHHKPSQLSQLTSDEILQYWALLSHEQRQAYILDKLREETGVEGLAVSSRTRRFLGGNSLFDRFAGIFHAFSCLRKSVDDAIEAEREVEAEARLFGSSYDGIPQLLTCLDDVPGDDPVRTYVTILCVRQLLQHVKREHPDFWRETKGVRSQVLGSLAGFDRIKDQLGLPREEADEFLKWYERAFLQQVVSPEAAE